MSEPTKNDYKYICMDCHHESNTTRNNWSNLKGRCMACDSTSIEEIRNFKIRVKHNKATKHHLFTCVKHTAVDVLSGETLKVGSATLTDDYVNIKLFKTYVGLELIKLIKEELIELSTADCNIVLVAIAVRPIKQIKDINGFKAFGTYISKSDYLHIDDAAILLEDVIDTLIEVDNRVTDVTLHQSADKLLKFRDKWFIQHRTNRPVK